MNGNTETEKWFDGTVIKDDIVEKAGDTGVA